MEKDAVKNEHISKKDLEEQTQILLQTFDSRFNKMEIYLDKRLNEVRDDLKIDINNLQILIDGYVKSQEDFKEEFIIMKEEFKQMKQIIKDKLGLEIKAI